LGKLEGKHQRVRVSVCSIEYLKKSLVLNFMKGNVGFKKIKKKERTNI